MPRIETTMTLQANELPIATERDAQRETALRNSRILSYLARQWMRRPRLFCLIAAATLAGTACQIALPVAAGGLIDALTQVERDGHAGVERAFVLFISLSIAAYVFQQITSRSEIWFSTRNMSELTAESFSKVQRFSADWHANTFAGATVRKISRGMWAYDMVTATLIFGLGPTTIVLVGMPLYVLTQWTEAGLFACGVSFSFIAVSVLASSYYIKPANAVHNERDSAIGAALSDSLGSNMVVKSFGAEMREEKRFASIMERWRRAAFRSWNRYANMGLVTAFCLVTLQTGLVGLLIQAWRAGQASPGDVAFAASAFLLMAGYMRRFNEELQNVQRSIDEIADLARFDGAQPAVADASDARTFAPKRGAISFAHVDFGYANQARRLYEDFSLEIAPGEHVALVGPTGSGKSTFVKLVQRLYDVDCGSVSIDGQDVRSVSQTSLRRAIALVPQDPALFHRSIAENIAYAQPDAVQADIESAARRARAHDFIRALPSGYDTLVGERGVKLSGGERQRVAIARALLADAPILILDEATSSLDNETERLVQEATDEAMAGRTTIVVAHRLSTIRAADRILVFDQGRIVEQGRHDELVGRGGVYARLNALAEQAG